MDEQILLCYPSFGSDEENVVCQGMWVDCAHNNQIMDALEKGNDPNLCSREPHWEAAYVAVLQHGGRWSGLSYEPRSVTVRPTHWQPLPKPTKVKS